MVFYFTTCTHGRILREAFPAGVARWTTVRETAIDIARVVQLGSAERACLYHATEKGLFQSLTSSLSSG